MPLCANDRLFMREYRHADCQPFIQSEKHVNWKHSKEAKLPPKEQC